MSSSTARADASKVISLDLLGRRGTKGEVEVREHLLVLEILGSQGLLAGVCNLLSLLVLGFALLGGVFILGPPRPGTGELVDER